MWLHGLILIVVVVMTQCADVEIPNMEAAFQGRCGHGSPCEQLCYELHDGMYECDCTEGYELNRNGYSCQEINSTFQSSEQDNQQIEEDILYQRGASFSAKLDDSNTHNTNSNNNNNNKNSSNVNSTKDEDTKNKLKTSNNNKKIHKTANKISSENKLILISTTKTNKLKSGTSTTISKKNTINDNIKYTKLGLKSDIEKSIKKHSRNKSIDSLNTPSITTINTSTTTNAPSTNEVQTSIDGYYSKEDVTVYDESISNNNENYNRHKLLMKDNIEDVNKTEIIYGKMINNNDKKKSVLNGFKQTNDNEKGVDMIKEKSRTNKSDDSVKATMSSCTLDCGLDGLCDSVDETSICLCPYGKFGNRCDEDIKIITPKFSRKSWLAFPALKGAYKHVQIHIEFRPESFDGIILLTGERDDLTGDFIALLIYQGFIEFWFDCGSGTGKVKSEETVVLNQWNTITIFRHRWDAWLILNQGNRVQGRSKGLFSRITFREPVFIGGTGNITGLAKKLPTTDGMLGCVRKFIANEHEYSFDILPFGDVTQGFDIQECSTDRCSHFPCHHGGKCLPSDQGAICLCPLGFGGDLCEMRLDLQVPSFNGSSYLRFAPLGDTAIIWFELKIILKPQQEDGLLMYSGHHEYGDYIALCLNMGFVEFTFDLGSGSATVRSEMPLSMGQWHTIKISRTARLAVLKIDQLPEVMTISPNGFWHLSLPHSLFLGGVHNMQTLPMRLREKGSFVGCIQKVEINNHPISIIAEALGGSNVDNCPHACVARPCGPLANCIPNLESYECQCNPFNAQCNQAEEISSEELLVSEQESSNDSNTNNDHTDYSATNDDESYYYDYDEDEDVKNDDAINNGNLKDGNNMKIDKYPVDEKTIKPSKDFIKITTTATQKQDQQQKQQSNDNDENNEMTPPTNGIRGRFMTHDNANSSSNSNSEVNKPETTVKIIKNNKGYLSSVMMKKNNKSSKQFLIKQKQENQQNDEVAHKQLQLDDNNKKYSKQKEIDDRTISNDYDNIKLISNYDLKKTFATIDEDVIEDVENPIQQRVQQQQRQVLEDNLPVHKQHKMRYRPEDDTVIDEIFIDGMDGTMKYNNIKYKLSNMKKFHGACFTGSDSYFHYNDVDTMKTIISYQIDLNLRFRTHSTNGLILWTGRHSAYEDDDFLSLGVENGYLHLRYNLGSGEVNIKYNSTKVSDGLWHRIRAMRNSQEGTLKIDGGKPIMQRSPGKLRQLNTDTGLYVGGMPNTAFYTRQKYINGIAGCISEIVLAGELRLNLDANKLGTAHNVEPGAP